jgi:inositol phosphorylceramide mannosyltransferase catalytic subunit
MLKLGLRKIQRGTYYLSKYYSSDEAARRIIRYLVINKLMNLIGMERRKKRMSSIANPDNSPVPLQAPLEIEQTNGIPKIVFQTWKNRLRLPDNCRYWRSTFLENNPDFQCLLWDDADNRAFIKNQFPWFLPVYDQFPAEIFRADAVRPFFLLRYGGLYADIDTECLRPIATMQTSGDVVLGQMGPDLSFEHSIPNAIMASRPSQLFWVLFITMMIARAGESVNPAAIPQGRVESITGSVLLREALEYYRSKSETWVREQSQPVIRQLSEELQARLYAGKVEVLPPTLWYPIDWNDHLHRILRSKLMSQRVILDPAEASALFPNSFLVTYWMHSWER